MSSISAFNPVDAALNSSGVNRFSEMTSEDFIRIIFTELSNQDPLAPNDTGALLDQLNSIRSIESDLKVVQQLESLVLENQLASAGNLLGKFIDGLTDQAERAQGYALSVIRRQDQVYLELDTGHLVPVENINTVIDVSLFDEPDPTESDGGDDSGSSGDGGGDGESDGGSGA